MKRTIICAMLLIMASATFSQQSNPSTTLTKQHYLQKSKNQKTAAWVLLGGGAVIDIIGIATFPKDYVLIDWGNNNTSSEDSRANTSAVLFVVGTASMLASIPFFIVSHVNKKKSFSITINTQQLNQLKNYNIYTLKYPALTMKIRL